MNRLRPEAGISAYNHQLRFTITMLRRHKVQHLGIKALSELRSKLRKARNERNRLREAYSEATDLVHIVEAEADDEIRVTHGLARLSDTRTPSLGLINRFFPDGLTPEVAPRGSDQAGQLRELADRIDARVQSGKIPTDHSVAQQVPLLRMHADQIEEVEKERKAIGRQQEKNSLQVRLLKARIREEFEVVNGALRMHYAANRRFVSRFFLPRNRIRSSAKARTQPTNTEAAKAVKPTEPVTAQEVKPVEPVDAKEVKPVEPKATSEVKPTEPAAAKAG